MQIDFWETYWGKSVNLKSKSHLTKGVEEKRFSYYLIQILHVEAQTGEVKLAYSQNDVNHLWVRWAVLELRNGS